MLQKTSITILCGLCSALAACDAGPPRDLMAPELEAGTLDAQSVSLLASSNTWTTRSPIPTAYPLARGATINGIIYVIGGYHSPFNSTVVQAYNVTTNSWSVGSRLMNVQIGSNGVSVINGRLYVTGGYDGMLGRMRPLYVYDPGKNTWTKKADMPYPAKYGAQGVIAGLLYVYGGSLCCGEFGSWFLRYNPANDAWVSLPSPPFHSAHLNGSAAGVIGGKFYLAGGYNQYDGFNGALHVYDPATNAWTMKASMPELVSGMASDVIAGKLFAAGGLDQNRISVGTLRVYDPASDTWTSGASMPTARSGAAGAAAGGLLFVIGGAGATAAGVVEAYTP